MDALEIARQARVEFDIVTHVTISLRLSLEAELILDTGKIWLDRIVFVFGSLQRHLERMFSIEEVGGHLSELEHKRPSLSPRLEKLRTDHPRLRESMAQLTERISKAKHDDMSFLAELRWELDRFLADVEVHRRDELQIIHEVYWDDVGGEG